MLQYCSHSASDIEVFLPDKSESIGRTGPVTAMPHPCLTAFSRYPAPVPSPDDEAPAPTRGLTIHSSVTCVPPIYLISLVAEA